MNVVFLDFDGVVNVPYWTKDQYGKYDCNYNMPFDGTVNNYQSIQWVSEFCEKYNYNIVVSSTWRLGNLDCSKCLYDSGLRESVKVVGCTPTLKGAERGDEITQYLNEHPEVESYLIFDDESDMTTHMDRLVECDGLVGFTLNHYNVAVNIHNSVFDIVR